MWFLGNIEVLLMSLEKNRKQTLILEVPSMGNYDSGFWKKNNYLDQNTTYCCDAANFDVFQY